MTEVTRWYMGFRYKGDPEALLGRISRYLYKENLTEYIPIIRTEKIDKKRDSKGGECYFFVAIESESPGVVPKPVQDKLLPLRGFKKLIKEKPYFTLEEIRGMVGKSENSVTEYGSRIPYRTREPHPRFDPLAGDGQPSIQPENRTATHDKLLYILSAWGTGSWYNFSKLSTTLGLEEPSRIVRRLMLLGHLERSSDGKRWSIAPAVASYREDGYVLCGQRSHQDLLRLKKAGIELRRCQHPLSHTPTRLRLPPQLTPQDITSLGWRWVEDASWQLAQHLPDLVGWRDSLEPLTGIIPSLFRWQRWEGDRLVDCTVPDKTGLYQMDSDGGWRKTLFYDAEAETWRQGDWYGLRFLALQEKRHAVYAPQSQKLWIPLVQRWPQIYERALVLASGLLPEPSQGGLVYSAVSEKLAQTLADKLSVTLERSHA